MANLSLPPLKMELGPAVSSGSSAVVKAEDAVFTAAKAESKPRLVGYDTIKTIDDIAPGMGASVKTRGLNSLVTMVKQNPKKAAAIATVTALGSVVGYEQLTDLAASHPIDTVRDFFENVLAGVDEIESKAGLNTLIPDTDEDIAGLSVNDVAQHFALVKAAEGRYEDAVAAVGGRARLHALMAWLAVDDDLKGIVLQNANT